MDHLDEPAVQPELERGPQSFVPVRDRRERCAQPGRVQRPTQPDGTVDVVRRPGAEQVERPQTLLPEGRGEDVDVLVGGH
jgi:hypothetical protein